MHKLAQGCAATHYPWEQVGAIRSILKKGMNRPGHLYLSPSGNGKVAILLSQGSGWAATLGCIINPLRGKRRFVDKSRGFQTKHLFRVCDQNKSQGNQ